MHTTMKKEMERQVLQSGLQPHRPVMHWWSRQKASSRSGLLEKDPRRDLGWRDCIKGKR
jgi:hypothetical protein